MIHWAWIIVTFVIGGAVGILLTALLDALPPGQIRQLMKDEACAAIFEKYGVTADD